MDATLRPRDYSNDFVNLCFIKKLLGKASECVPCPTGKYCRNGAIAGDCDDGYFCLAGASERRPQVWRSQYISKFKFFENIYETLKKIIDRRSGWIFHRHNFEWRSCVWAGSKMCGILSPGAFLFPRAIFRRVDFGGKSPSHPLSTKYLHGIPSRSGNLAGSVRDLRGRWLVQKGRWRASSMPRGVLLWRQGSALNPELPRIRPVIFQIWDSGLGLGIRFENLWFGIIDTV